MNNEIERAWDLFRNIVALARGAEEHAAEAERAACCAVVLEDEDRSISERAALEHTGMAQRYACAAKKYCRQLQALAESSGNGHVADHLRNAENHVSRAEKAKICAMEADEALAEILGGRPITKLVCQMTKL